MRLKGAAARRRTRDVDKQEDDAIIKMLEELTGKTLTPLQRVWATRVSRGEDPKMFGRVPFDRDHKPVPPEAWENKPAPLNIDLIRQAVK